MSCITINSEVKRSFPKLIDITQVQEDIDKEIINSLYNYKPFSKYLSNG